MDRFGRVARIAARQHGLVSLADIAAAGVPRGAVQRWAGDGRLRRVRPKVYVVAGAPPT